MLEIWDAIPKSKLNPKNVRAHPERERGRPVGSVENMVGMDGETRRKEGQGAP